MLSNIQTMKFSGRQQIAIISQIVDNLIVYGKPSTIVENLSHFLQSVRTIQRLYTDWRHQNQLMLWYHKLWLGFTLKINPERFKTQVNDESKDNSEAQLSRQNAPLGDMNNLSAENSYNFQLDKSDRVERPSKSIKESRPFVSDIMSIRISKADSVIAKRESIQKNKNTSTSFISKREFAKESIFRNELNKIENKLEDILDRDKRIYKQIILAGSSDKESEPFEYISIHKRTMRNKNDDTEYEYKIKLSAYWSICK